MNYLHWKIPGNKGDIVKVKMNEPAFVRLLDPLNFDSYRLGRKFQGEGGWSDQPHAEFSLPYKGTFHLVIDLGGAQGEVRATVDIGRV